MKFNDNNDDDDNNDTRHYSFTYQNEYILKFYPHSPARIGGLELRDIVG